VDALKKELDQLKKKLKKEEKEKAEAQVQKKEREDLLQKSTTALLGNFIAMSSNSFSALLTSYFCFYFLQELPIFLQIL
jgi:hypothetical protein